ncbi:hypothetical protein BO70DRAFT_391720 [Aspergillus heteromorphus CBS 117.55]|uniref:LysM domain-containing protein n=1 Tax=Aspergillus heteromorphus CBS 117.55 TaxID=1448321 RepID=A0A317X0Y4_9EURO|nr:uncharacterized protein BO70DRAFT_391720 [Aspergillus heteromorphus CBS 117.55]PWY92304.1 hypothetical protein BO70DRAFT_391720 [Aspergillus heteromorphus CBS 117.55]
MHLLNLLILPLLPLLTTAQTEPSTPPTPTPTTLQTVISAAAGPAIAAAAAAPSPTQPGIAANCNAFHLVSSGETCTTIAAAAGISLANFYAWNPSVGTGCDTLWLGYYVCTGVSPTSTRPATSTTATAVATPSPTQSGMVGNCGAFYLVATGDTCTTIAQKEGVSVQNIISWNPAVGTGCTNLWWGYYICVGTL